MQDPLPIVTAADLVNALEPLEGSMWTDVFGIRSAFYLPRDKWDLWTKDTTKREPIVDVFFVKSVKVTRMGTNRVSIRIPLAMFMALMVAASDTSITTEQRNASLRRQAQTEGDFAMNREASDAGILLEILRGSRDDVMAMLLKTVFDRWRESKDENAFSTLVELTRRLQIAQRLEGVPSGRSECCS